MTDTKRKGDVEGGPPKKSARGSQHSDTEKDCSLCKKIDNEAKFAGIIKTMHVDIRVICPVQGSKRTDKEKQEIREKKQGDTRRILENICALRNTTGGCLVVHFENMKDEDRYIGVVDEMIDDRLQELIEDGKLFSDSYKRQWVSLYPNCLFITCNTSGAISTLDYKSQMSLNKGFGRLTALNIRYLLVLDKPTPKYDELPLTDVQEQSNIQLKSFINYAKVPIEDMARHIMEELRLREYIAAFANQISGGYFFLGIAERVDNTLDYHRKKVILEGFRVSLKNQQLLKNDLLRLINDEMLWVKRNMDIQDRKIVDKSIIFNFHKVPNKDGYWIMEVFVYPVEGIVFHDKSGPESFILSEEKELLKIGMRRWHEKILKLKMPGDD